MMSALRTSSSVASSNAEWNRATMSCGSAWVRAIFPMACATWTCTKGSLSRLSASLKAASMSPWVTGHSASILAA